MKASRLKTLVLLIWGSIVLVCVILSFITVSSDNVRALFQPETTLGDTVTSHPQMTVTPSMTPSPWIRYLPSATARAATAMPVTPTVPYTAPLPMAQYNATLGPDASPLTGLVPADPAILNRRPVAVKISSFPRGLVRHLQTGLSQADLVFEYYIEDGLTRFIAIFNSRDASRAGPVRSGRYFDEYVMRMYHSALVYGHADKRVEDYLLQSDLLPYLFEEQASHFPPLWDSGSKNAENRLYVNTAGVGPKLSDNRRQNIRPPLFAPLLYPQSLPAVNKIYTHYSIYSYNYWEYDSESKLYKRFSDAADATSLGQGEVYAPQIDNLNGTQLSADNVVVLVVPHIFHNEFDRADQLLDISLKGTGEAYVFRNGRMIKASWTRDQIDQPIQLKDEKNLPVPMKPGVTYFQVIDPESTISQIDTTMDFRFFIQLFKVTSTPTPFGWEPTPTPTRVKKH